jgi:hypothetical protein
MKDNILRDSVNSALIVKFDKYNNVLTGFMHAAREHSMSETLRRKEGKIRNGNLQHIPHFFTLNYVVITISASIFLS